MAAHLSYDISTIDGPLNIAGHSGDVVLFTGPNGVGKSALIHDIFRKLGPSISEIFPGHRQIHFQSDDIDTIGHTMDALVNLRFTNAQSTNRYRDIWSEIHLKSVVKRFVEHENQSNRDVISTLKQYAKSNRKGSTTTAEEVTAKVNFALEGVEGSPSVIDKLNEIFETARLEVRILLQGGLLKACRNGHVYGLDRLSDGERAALLLVAAILVRQSDTTIIIDEPEKHLNPAISGALIAAAVRARPDLIFVFSSHDLSLIDWLSPRLLLTVKGSLVTEYEPEARLYEVYIVDLSDGVPEEVKRSILGVRKSVLFVEGTAGSDDPALYGQLFKDRSVVAKGGWENVVPAVRVLRGNTDYNWVTVSGLIDNDGRTLAERRTLEADHVYCLEVPSIENLFFLKDVVSAMCEIIYRFKGGKTPSERFSIALGIIPELLTEFKEAVVDLRVVWIANRLLSERKVSVKSIRDGQAIIESVDIASIRAQELTEFTNVTSSNDFDAISKLAIKKTGIPARLSTAIGYADFRDYRSAVFHQMDLDSDTGRQISDSMRARIPPLRAT